MLNYLLNHIVINELSDYLFPILVSNPNQIPTLYQRLLIRIVDIQPL